MLHIIAFMTQHHSSISNPNISIQWSKYMYKLCHKMVVVNNIHKFNFYSKEFCFNNNN